MKSRGTQVCNTQTFTIPYHNIICAGVGQVVSQILEIYRDVVGRPTTQKPWRTSRGTSLCKVGLRLPRSRTVSLVAVEGNKMEWGTFFCCVSLNATDLAIPQIWPWMRSPVVSGGVSGYSLSCVAVVLVGRGALISTWVVGRGSANVVEVIPVTGSIGEMRCRGEINSLIGCLEWGFEH